MGQRHSKTLQRFIHEWGPNGDAKLATKFVADTRRLIFSFLAARADGEPDKTIEVGTVLASDGGVVVLRVGGYEAQFTPIECEQLALRLFEVASSARTESFLKRFFSERVGAGEAAMKRMIEEFREYRAEDFQRTLDAKKKASEGKS